MFIHQKQTIDYRYAHCDCKSQNLREVQNQAFVYLLWWICEFDIDCWFGILNPASSKPVKLPGVNGCFQGMYIFPLLELLNVALHPNPVVSIGFQEEIIIDGKREEDVVLQIARRDMPKGDRCKANHKNLQTSTYCHSYIGKSKIFFQE